MSSARSGDTGGASRFFYVSKASSIDRGNVKAGALPLFGEGEHEERNPHPTVKPTSLMRYLCTLTKPPEGGTILDPFMGSGSTLIAARQTGRRAIGVEISEEYAEIAAKRLERTARTIAKVSRSPAAPAEASAGESKNAVTGWPKAAATWSRRPALNRVRPAS